MPRCPSCFTQLTRTEEDQIKFSVCANCFGSWISSVCLLRRTRLDLARLNKLLAAKSSDNANVGTSAAADPLFDSPLSDLAEIVQASDSKGMLRCPQCEKPMQKDRFHAMIPVQIDRCKPCSSIWLDAGELTLLRRLYAELMASTDPEIVRRREKVATAIASWDTRRTALDDATDAVNAVNSFDSSATTLGFDLINYLLRAP